MAKKTFLAVGFFLFFQAVIFCEIHFGPISLIKRRLRDLKTEKEENQWSELTSPLSGYYVGNSRLVSANSPYVVTGEVVFQDGEIEIEPDVRIVFSGKYNVKFERLDRPTTLEVKGSSSTPVYFISYSTAPGTWGSIYITNCDATIDYAVFQYATTGLRVAGNSTIRNSFFRYNSENGMLIGESTAPDHYAMISHCEFTDNGSNGILVNGANSAVNMEYCEIIDNNRGFYIWKFKSFLAQDNNIFNNGSDDVYCIADANADMEYNWWGTTNTLIIDANIGGTYDYKVDYDPIRTSTVTIAGVE